jgi:F0F1-type ATP synthase assembly protein I
LLPARGTGLTSGRGAGAITSLGESSREGEKWNIAIGAIGGALIGAFLGYLIRGGI